jgi:hypothetical protein
VHPRWLLGERERIRREGQDERRNRTEGGKRAHAIEIGARSEQPSPEWVIFG